MPPSPKTERIDTAALASELRVVLGQVIRRLRAEYGFPIAQASVLGRLDRGGPQSVSELAAAERVRPQSMAQTVGDLEADGLVERHPDPVDRRRSSVQLTAGGRERLYEDRRRRDGWLARAIEEDLSPREQALLGDALELLRRVADS
jgi:DNA-binding MarR family transcriptional regulator